MATPGTGDSLEDPTPLDAAESTRYRALVARANYLAQDRPEILYATKELSRSMAAPRVQDWGRLKRLGRYLLTRQRSVQLFKWQQDPGHLVAWTDSNWAGCERTRKSTSGGAIMYGSHLIKAWSQTQGHVALSSGEAEYYAITKGATVGLGLKHMMAETGVERTGSDQYRCDSGQRHRIETRGGPRQTHRGCRSVGPG